MKTILTRLLICVALLASAAVALLPVGTASAAGSVLPTQGAPGSTFIFTADGYKPGERLAAWVNTPSNVALDAHVDIFADQTGRMAWRWTPPVDAETGTWQMVALGIDSDVTTLIPVQLVAGTPATDDGPYALPAAGLPGTAFIFYATGYAPFEPVNYWATSPVGETLVNNIETRADNLGRANWRWTSPDSAIPGNWVMSGLGKESRVGKRIGFAITSTNAPTPVPAPGTPPIAVSPASGPLGTQFTFSAIGLLPQERVAYWMTNPRGETLIDDSSTFADAAGHAEWRWGPGPDDPTGTWTMSARGVSSHENRLITFDVTPVGAPPAAAAGSVTPASGLPDSDFVFTVTGFGPAERIDYWAIAPSGGAEVTHANTTTDNEGRAEWQWTSPAYAAPGVWTMTVQGATSRTIVRIAFTITAPGGVATGDSVTPSSGPPGTEFLFHASGLGPNVDVSFWLLAPDGSTFAPEDSRIKADDQGQVEFYWQSPQNVQEGNWQMVIYGQQSNITHKIPFRIQSSTPPSAPAQGVMPSSGPPGTDLVFFVAGVPPTMLLEYFATNPSGVGEPVPNEVRADANGRAEWHWVIPQGAEVGTWRMSVQRSINDTTGAADVRRVIEFSVVSQ